jgi:hypothetical protein
MPTPKHHPAARHSLLGSPKTGCPNRKFNLKYRLKLSRSNALFERTHHDAAGRGATVWHHARYGSESRRRAQPGLGRDVESLRPSLIPPRRATGSPCCIQQRTQICHIRIATLDETDRLSLCRDERSYQHLCLRVAVATLLWLRIARQRTESVGRLRRASRQHD